MTTYPGMPVDTDEALKAGLEIARAQGLAKLEREQAEAQAREAQARARRAADVRSAEDRAITQLSGLRPLYAKRQQLAEQCAQMIAEFYETEKKLAEQNAEIRAELTPFWNGIDVLQLGPRWLALRRQANLLPEHTTIGLAPRLPRIALTIFSALVRKNILPGVIVVGSKEKRFDFDEGV